ncbi:MBL fold metallo-hydrolase [Piscinibacter sakaiensis]|uniref:Outer membrane protein romA n=1 Tax=Piscinibacter sakaiensis TaxID=1547922 RepID=A0A0K8NVR7_PISS1|nr:MBL fold metallo-hydrolase [Piscinibacter sakaiensis]GAP34487.1 outer membrane protein romA [Piscinibacter sakaiensis]
MKSFGARAAGARRERMQASPRWAGEGFRNVHPVLPGLRDPSVARPSLGDFLCGGERRVPAGPLPVVDPRPGWQRAPSDGLRATWLGHSAVLLEIDGATVLTDPVWGPRASPLRLAGPKRFQPAPVALRQLPPLDAVLISHDHYDHLDLPTVRELARRPGLPFVTSLGVGAHLEAWGIPPERIVELDWWESHTLPRSGLCITAAPSQHFSGRSLKDRNATLWSSLVLRSPRHAVFFSGDTGLTTEYATIRERLGPFDLVMLEVGAFHPSWGDIHLGPENALKAHALLGGGAFLPVHWGTFSLALHAWDEPAEVLLGAAGSLGAPLLMPRLGEPVEPLRGLALQPWWRGVDGRAGPAVAPPVATAGDLAADREGRLPWPLD